MSKYQPVIGFEVHVELSTRSKMFCGCDADFFGKEPNTHTCPVCLGLPGALPVPNKKAVEWTIMLGEALGCTIAHQSKFDRKHYFYPDLPKGYQISQYDQPLCADGKVETSHGTVRITRIHLEEDTGKLQHKTVNGQKVSLVDFNRSGVPLVEIVTEPDISSPEQADEYARHLRDTIRYLGISDADMEKGSMRLEANISLGMDLGYKVEVKNVNSFRYIKKAIEYELERQEKILKGGQTPAQETRGYNEKKGVTFSQRTKEEAADYRYFPEPDIPPMAFSDTDIEAIVARTPELKSDYHRRFKNWGLRDDYIDTFLSNPKTAIWATSVIKAADKHGLKPKTVANYLINQQVDHQTPVNEIIQGIQAERKQPQATKSQMALWVEESMQENQALVDKYRDGKKSVLGAFIGDIMKRSKGEADAKIVSQLLKEKLDD